MSVRGAVNRAEQKASTEGDVSSDLERIVECMVRIHIAMSETKLYRTAQEPQAHT